MVQASDRMCILGVACRLAATGAIADTGQRTFLVFRLECDIVWPSNGKSSTERGRHAYLTLGREVKFGVDRMKKDDAKPRRVMNYA